MCDSAYVSESYSNDSNQKCTVQKLKTLLKQQNEVLKLLDKENAELKNDLASYKSKSDILERNLGCKEREIKILKQDMKILATQKQDLHSTSTSNTKKVETEILNEKNIKMLLGSISQELNNERQFNIQNNMTGFNIIQNGIHKIVNNTLYKHKLKEITTSLTLEDLTLNFENGTNKLHEFLSKIEKIESDNEIRKQIFVDKVNNDILNLIDRDIHSIEWNEIKSLLYKNLPDKNLIEEVIKLRSSTWTGTNDQLIFYTELKAKYDILMFDQTPPIKFKDIIITALTNEMEPENKYTCREIMMDDCMEGIKNISKLYNKKGKHFFFKNTNVEKEINCIYPRNRDVSKSNGNTNDNKEIHCNTKTHQRKDKGRKLTPYQGTRKCIGDFFCPCGHVWRSKNSFANKDQKCYACFKSNYPYRQYPLYKCNKPIFN